MGEKKGESPLYQGKGVGKAIGVERKTPISSKERGLAQGGGISYPYFLNELLEIAGGIVQRD